MVNTLITQTQISERIEQLAQTIIADYQGQKIVLVGVLKGSFIFLADLSRALWKAGFEDTEIDFVGISSYGDDTETSRNPRIYLDLSTDIQNRHVLIVEDIVDTGYSLESLLRILHARHPASLKTCVLLSKTSRREIQVPVEYIGFEVDGWIEGYGLDVRRACPDVLNLTSE